MEANVSAQPVPSWFLMVFMMVMKAFADARLICEGRIMTYQTERSAPG